MPASTSRLAYVDCFDVLDRALADSGDGCRVRRRDRNDAVNFRSRLHYARKLDRKENELTYEIGDPLYGKSPYDPLTCSIEKDKHGRWWVNIRKVSSEKYHIESINDGIDESADSDHGEATREEETTAPRREGRRA